MGEARRAAAGLGEAAGPSQDDLEAAAMRLSACRRLVAAAVVFLFPVLFVLDGWVSTAFSPVLPGLLVLLVVLGAGPVVLMGVLVRRARRRGTLVSPVPVFRLHSRATALLVVSALVLLAWLGWEG